MNPLTAMRAHVTRREGYRIRLRFYRGRRHA